MKMVNCFGGTVLLFILCQGCTLAPSDWQARAKFMDLGNGICQQSNGLMWQVERSGPVVSGQKALNYVQDLQLGNYSDWRLPTKDELYELCYLNDMKLAGDCPLESQGSYWSMNGKVQAGEWQVYSLCGGTEYQYRGSKTGRVRAVRP